MSKPQSDLLRRTIVASLHGTTRHDIVNKDLGHHVPLRLGRGEGEIYNTLKAQKHELARMDGCATSGVGPQMLVATSPPTRTRAGLRT